MSDFSEINNYLLGIFHFLLNKIQVKHIYLCVLPVFFVSYIENFPKET